MTLPTDDQVASLRTALDAFTRRYKLVDAGKPGKALNEVDIQTLLYVADHPSCGPTDVARFLDVASTTISSATDRLVKRGLLARHRPEGNRRAVALLLTAQGEAHVAAHSQAHGDLYRMMLERLSPGERDGFIDMITKIVYHDD